MSCKECEKCFACEVQCGRCFACQACVACERGVESQAQPQHDRRPMKRPFQQRQMLLTEERVKEIMVEVLTELGLIKKPKKQKVIKIE